MRRLSMQGFTLVEVLVALMVVALGLTALMVTVSSTARTSGYLRDKTLAQWIGLNRLAEVRLNLNKFAQNTDTGEVDFAGRTWHYDTRYFDTTIGSMKRVVVRVYAGDAKTKGNPLAETDGFVGTALSAPGTSNIDWSTGTTVATAAPAAATGTAGSTTGTSGTTPGTTGANGSSTTTTGTTGTNTTPTTTTPTP